MKLYYCVITPFNYSMDFRYSTASHARFGGIMLHVHPAHTAGCGGAQACRALGEVLKTHDFFYCRSYSLRACSRLVLVLQETCLRMPNQAYKIVFCHTNCKLDSSTPENSLQAAKTWKFAKFMMFRIFFSSQDEYFQVIHRICRECPGVDNSP